MKLIDKDAILEAMEREWSTFTDIDDFYYLVKNFHSIDMEPMKHGQWEYNGESTFLRAHYRCSVCGSLRYEHYAWNYFKFCPECGAKMDGE